MTVSVDICMDVIVRHLMNDTDDNQRTQKQQIDLGEWAVEYLFHSSTGGSGQPGGHIGTFHRTRSLSTVS